MEWFKKHLNIALLGALIICNGVAIWGYWGIPRYENSGIVLVILAIVLSIGSEIWYLRQKECSMFNLLWNLLPYVGFIMILLLDNKIQREKKLESKSDTKSPPTP
jgi:hypothetical protein